MGIPPQVKVGDCGVQEEYLHVHHHQGALLQVQFHGVLVEWGDPFKPACGLFSDRICGYIGIHDKLLCGMNFLWQDTGPGDRGTVSIFTMPGRKTVEWRERSRIVES